VKSIILTLLAIITGAAVGAAFAVFVQRESRQPATASPPPPPQLAVETIATNTRPGPDPETRELIESLTRTVASLESRVRSLDDQLAAVNRDLVTATLRVDSLQEPIQAIQQTMPAPGERFVPFRPSGIIPRNRNSWETELPFPETLAPPDDSLPLPRW